MNSQSGRFARVKRLLLEARELAVDAREGFVRERAGDDEALAREVLELLRADAVGRAILDEGIVPAAGHPRTLGPFEIESVLGEGGMGVVYRARQREPIDRTVAIKLIRCGHSSASVVRRFEQERRALARMDHPHIATVLDAGVDGTGYPWFAMALVEGRPLVDFCDERASGLEERLRLFVDVCRAVQHAHGRGVLHRDLKPGNILVREVEGHAVPTIIDFGIAKALEEDDESATLLTRVGQSVGTPAYMSPEQLASQEVDARSDVYALGVILHELLAGRRPQGSAHDAAPPSTVIDAGALELARRRGLDPRALRRRLRGDLDTICAMALRHDVHRRYASAAHLADDIERHLDGHPVLARPDSLGYRAGKFVRRHPGRAAVGIASVVLLVLGAIGLTWHAGQLAAERDRAVAAEARAQRELATSTAISDFMERLFVNAQPGQGTPGDVSARELLAQGEDRVRDALADEPWLQGRLYRVLANLRHSISQLDVADSLLVEATAANARATTRSASERDLQAGQIRELRAIVLHDLGRYAEAESIQRESLRLLSASGSADSSSIAVGLNNLGTYLQVQGKLRESIAPTLRALRMQERHGSQDVAEIAWGWGSLGYIHAQLGQAREAEEEFRHALELAREHFGKDHYDVAHHLNNLGGLLVQLERYDEAEPYVRENLAMNQRIFGDEPHGSLARAYLLMGRWWLERGDARKAHEACRTGYEIAVRGMGARHPRVAASLAGLAFSEQAIGRPDSALAHMLEADAIRAESLPERHRARFQGDFELGRLRLQRGESGLALPRLRAWSAHLARTLPPGHYRRAIADYELARAELVEGMVDSAVTRLGRASRLLETSLGPASPLTTKTRVLLAEARAKAP